MAQCLPRHLEESAYPDKSLDWKHAELYPVPTEVTNMHTPQFRFPWPLQCVQQKGKKRLMNQIDLQILKIFQTEKKRHLPAQTNKIQIKMQSIIL